MIANAMIRWILFIRCMIRCFFSNCSSAAGAVFIFFVTCKRPVPDKTDLIIVPVPF